MLRGSRDVSVRIARSTLDAFVDDERETLRVERVRAGAYNRVFFLREYDDVVVRVSRDKLDEDERIAYRAEIETQRVLARHGIAPRVFCVVHVLGAAGPKGAKTKKRRALRTVRTVRPVRPVRLGCAMERFDLSLAEAIDTGYDFGPNDGWSTRTKRALVELFERAATLVRCVDTTASNVVVRSSGSGVEFRLIDVDGHFCGRAASEPESVRDAMRAWETGHARASAGAYAALSLLVLCVHARLAWLARMLLKHEVGLVRLLADDEAAQTMVSARDRLVWTRARVSAMHMVRAYADERVRAPHDVPAVLRAIAR